LELPRDEFRGKENVFINLPRAIPAGKENTRAKGGPLSIHARGGERGDNESRRILGRVRRRQVPVQANS